MNVGISTFHFAPNSGAMLQCYALQRAITNLGHNPVVINYRPEYHLNKYKPLRNPFSESKSIREFLSIVYYDRNALKRSSRNRKFEEFEAYYHQTELFHSINEWGNLNLELDAIVCGSDQIWNKKLTNSAFDKAYFADFPGFAGRKIAYAPSMGETDVEENAIELETLLKDFSSLSTREYKDSLKLQKVLHREVVCVPDPTLLLSKEYYMELFTHINEPNKYILIYVFGRNSLLENVVAEALKQYNLPIVSISPYQIPLGKKYTWVNNLSPREFLTYIYNSQIVITNSFHCSLFSLMFNKPLLLIKNGNRNERLVNLLNVLGANSVIIEDNNDIGRAIEQKCDYHIVNDKLMRQSYIGNDYLIRAFGE